MSVAPTIRKKKKKVFTEFEHPETELGETLLNYFTLDRFERLEGLKSKRIGNTTYDRNGLEILGTSYKPVFVSEVDYQVYRDRLAVIEAEIKGIKKRQKRN
jgi:hypothetical protein